MTLIASRAPLSRRSFLRLVLIAGCCSVFSGSCAFAEDGATVAVSVPQGDRLQVRVPQGWQHDYQPPTPASMPTLKLGLESAGVSVRITFIPVPDDRFSTKESVEKVVTQTGGRFVGNSVEKKITLVPVDSKNGHGCHASFEDASLVGVAQPKAGEYRFITTGMFVIGKQAAAVTIMSNDTTGATFKEAIKVIAEGIVPAVD
jgi:hypothetical protein